MAILRCSFEIVLKQSNEKSRRFRDQIFMTIRTIIVHLKYLSRHRL